MSRINTPINQVKLTNVAVVRSNKGGKRFEIACYRNKVMDFRKGLETDLSEVLQTDRIFTNVSKGQFANHADLLKVFDTKDEEVIARIILEKGQLQVTDLERQAMLESTLAQIATWVSRHCVHPQSQRPYTVTQVRHALKNGQYQVQPHKPIKKQYLDCVKFLKAVIPIERAKMELVLSYEQQQQEAEPNSNDSKSEARQQLHRVLEEQQEASLLSVVSHQKDPNNNSNDVTKCTLLADPSLYRILDDLAKLLPKGKLDVLRQVVTQEGDIDLELELERKTQLQETQKHQQRLQQQHQRSGNDIQSSDDDDDDDGTAMLAKQFKQNAAIHDDDEDDDSDGKGHKHNDDDSDDNDGELMPTPVSRKKQNKQNKKLSKKAKRRQKEEQAEREARLQAEQERQDARKRRMGTDDGDDTQNDKPSIVQMNAATAAANGDAGKSCNTCGGSFPTAAAYRAHFKSDWHRFNQKLKLQKMAPVSEQEFILCDAESFFGA